MRLPRTLSCGLSLLLCLGWSPAGSAAPRRVPPLLFGGAPPPSRAATPIDPLLPTGAAIMPPAPRPTAARALCSFSRPVCVHASAQTSEVELAAALLAFEVAYERVVLALELPAPRADAGEGGSDALDLYLDTELVDLVVEQAVPRASGFDSASAYCRAPAGSELIERFATLCVAEAIASRLDPGESAALRRAFALETWWIVGRPTALDVELIDDAQRVPERALAVSGTPASGAFLFELLETTRSAAPTGSLSAALLSAAASRTAASASHFDNEPDAFDVVRHSLDEEPAKFADLLVELALRRATLGARDDGTHFPGLGFAGDFGRAHFDWVVRFSSLPRNVLSGRPIEPTGAELIWLDLDDVTFQGALGFRAEWEAPVSFQWRLMLLRADGSELSRVDIPFQERARFAEGRVRSLEGARALVIAGVNLGAVDLAHPYDPDVRPFEPAACTVYLARM